MKSSHNIIRSKPHSFSNQKDSGPADRDPVLRELMGQLPETHRDIVRSVAIWMQATGSTIYETELADVVRGHATENGDPDALEGALFDLDPVQESYEVWMNVLDREAVLCGLRLLHGAGPLTHAMRDMLTFYFRASDPALYQHAALVLGMHLGGDPALYDWFANYLQKRTLRIDAPIALNNIRSSRRVLIALASSAASTASPHPSLEEKPFPSLPLDPSEAELTERLSAPDLDVYLLALCILLERPEWNGRLAEHAAVLVQELAANKKRTINRVTVERWMDVLRVLAHNDPRALPASPGVLLARRLAIELQHLAETISVGSRVRQLFLVDTLIRLAVEWPENVRREWVSAWTPSASDELETFLKLRLRTWANRKDTDWHEAIPFSTDMPSFLQLTCAVESASPPEESQLTGPPRDRRFRDLITSLAGSLQTKHTWAACSPAERALRAFLLLDYCLHPPIPSHEMEALLATNGLAVEQEAAFYSVLQHVLACEGEGSDGLIDSHWLYQTENLPLLLSLIPPERNSPLLPVLADTLEHRLRLALVSDPGTDFGSFLVAIAARRPHASFWHHLRRITGERTYTSADGRIVPLHQVIDVFLEEASSSLPEQTSHLLPASAEVFAASGSAVLNAVAALRERLGGLQSVLGLQPKLHAFATLLRSDTRDTLDDLASIVEAPFGTSGSPPRPDGPAALAVRLLTLLDERGHTLRPTRFDEAVRAIETARRTITVLDDIAARFAPALPYVEQHLVAATCRHLAGELTAWAGTLDRIWVHWNEARNYAPEAFREACKMILQEIASLANEALQEPGYRMVWASMQANRRDVNDPWQHRFALLEWGVNAVNHEKPDASTRIWYGLLTETWEELAAEAMRDGYETRLSLLIRTENLHPLRQAMPGDDILLRMKKWFMDCYRLGDVSHVQRWLKDLAGFAVVRDLPRFYTSFFIHFSAVWTALVIGAILMLDFGDAWTSMAEVGDIRGILITFLLGTAGAFAYMFTDLQMKVANAPEDSAWANRLSRLARVSLFLIGCLLFTLAVTGFLWFLLSGTDEVVHGANAILHVLVWTGFALFVGVFFGLLAKAA